MFLSAIDNMPVPLPEFDLPPVVEVALAIQFDPLNTTYAQLAFAWDCFRDKFPKLQEQPALEPMFEQFNAQSSPTPGIRFALSQAASGRLWFVNEEDSELVQLQRDRFIRNWRQTTGAIDYPRYDCLRESFIRDWSVFEKFVRDVIRQDLIPNQCEVTYVNIIDDVDFGNLSAIIKCFGPFENSAVGNPEDVKLSVRYRLPNRNDHVIGRLHLEVAPAIRSSDNSRVLRMSLTARGAPQEQSLEGSLDFFDIAHESVVNAFTNLTTSEMHRLWRRKQ